MTRHGHTDDHAGSGSDRDPGRAGIDELSHELAGRLPIVVIELLTFAVPAHERESWMEVEERTWSRFLERQPGFVRKQMWVEQGDDDHVHAVIWWESMQHWKSVSDEESRAVDESMGEWLRPPTMRVFDVVRDC